LKQQKKTASTGSRRLQAFLSISKLCEEIFTQFFTQSAERSRERGTPALTNRRASAGVPPTLNLSGKPEQMLAEHGASTRDEIVREFQGLRREGSRKRQRGK